MPKRSATPSGTTQDSEVRKLSLDRVDELMRLVFLELKSRGGSGRPKDVLAAVAAKARLSAYELEPTEWFRSRGLPGARWDTAMRFWTTDCARAGLLTKEGGVWFLTDAGEKALRLPAGQMIRHAAQLTRKQRSGHLEPPLEEPESAEPEEDASNSETTLVILEKAREDARLAIDARIDSLGPYEFQTLVAELLAAMGYHIRHVAPPGADGGLDILAFRDPLGTEQPHIKVQVKHRVQKLDVREVRELAGILHRDGDIGLLVSSSGFTRDAEREIAQSAKHLDRIDRGRLLDLWIEHYAKVSEAGRRLLPLLPVYFYAPGEE